MATSQAVSLAIVRVIDGWDMRRRHKLREKSMKGLKYGQCVVALNGRHSMARVIDCVGGVHDYYADDGMRFDMQTVSQMMTQGLKLKLTGIIKYDREIEQIGRVA